MDACKEVVHEEGVHEAHHEGEDAGKVLSSTPRTTISSRSSSFSPKVSQTLFGPIAFFISSLHKLESTKTPQTQIGLLALS